MRFLMIIMGFLFTAGFFTYLEIRKEANDEKEIKAYVTSHGKTPVPSSWRSQMGKGI